jgi:hypothetical protein
MNRIICLTLLTLAAALTPGCCYNHYREWRLWSPVTPKESRTLLRKVDPPPTPQTPFDGRWEGRWTSNRHRVPFTDRMESGNLRCIFTQIDPYRYRANFRAEWMLGASEYLAELYGRRRGDVLHLRGESQVSPIFGGKYQYDGTVTPSRFTLNYDSKYDSGTFEMRKLP